MPQADNVVECPELRDRTRVFADRADAGRRLARLLEALRASDPVVYAIPAGGIPVSVALAEELGLRLDLAVVSKVTLPYNTEVGYGAVAFDGTVRLNGEMIREVGLSKREVARGIEKTRAKVKERAARLRGPGLPIVPRGVTAILVDDGLASGFTMLTAAEALRNRGARGAVIAVPTGHTRSIARLARHVERIFCANVRSGMSFAVADAYENWYDVGEEEAATILRGFRKR
ncbi:MAG: phosphoribosyltransferase [Kiritimatiellae bacterium]|nr:phosphoribosyltransferase [Kiritimatiellia bacterium]